MSSSYARQPIPRAASWSTRVGPGKLWSPSSLTPWVLPEIIAR